MLIIASFRRKTLRQNGKIGLLISFKLVPPVWPVRRNSMPAGRDDVMCGVRLCVNESLCQLARQSATNSAHTVVHKRTIYYKMRQLAHTRPERARPLNNRVFYCMWCVCKTSGDISGPHRRNGDDDESLAPLGLLCRFCVICTIARRLFVDGMRAH